MVFPCQTSNILTGLPGGFTLVNSKAGYDVPGTMASYKAPRGQSFQSKLRYCVGKCKKLPGCSGFTLYGASCYMKDSASTSKTAEFKGDGTAGGRWYYIAESSTWLPLLTNAKSCTIQQVLMITVHMVPCKALACTSSCTVNVSKVL
jgi:hypothetical protein